MRAATHHAVPAAPPQITAPVLTAAAAASFSKMDTVKTVGAGGFDGTTAPKPLVVKHLGLTPYEETFAAMRAFTAARDANMPDEIWLTEHLPVYTQGLAGKREHVLDTGGIALVQTDRGGQVTYHAPGQVIAYVLLDLVRRNLKVRELVRLIEEAVIATVRECGAEFGGIDSGIASGIESRTAGGAARSINPQRRSGMPGVYVEDAKLAALGLKVKQGRSYHGVSLNVDLDLQPFAGIHPCGYQGLRVTSLKALGVTVPCAQVSERLAGQLIAHFNAHRAGHYISGCDAPAAR